MKTLKEYEGKKAKKIFYGKDGECFRESQKGDHLKEIICTDEYHGEYDLVWFVVLENGVETGRVNAKFIESIEWEKDESNP